MVDVPAGSVVYFGENINKVAAQHWQSFATQDYFDSRGIFYSVMVSGPAVVNLFTVLVGMTACQHSHRHSLFDPGPPSR